MQSLSITRNQLEYVGLYSRPAFTMWGAGEAILEGLYDAFSGNHSGLADFRVEGDPTRPADQAVMLTIGSRAEYRFKFDRTESTLYNFSTADVAVYPDLLRRGRSWIQNALPQLTFQSHLITYTAHAKLNDEGASDVLLRSLSGPSIASLGNSRGTGLIFHADHPTWNWRVQLTVDHSVLVASGVYLQFLILTLEPDIDFEQTLVRGRSLFNSALNDLDIRLEEEGAL